MDKALNAVALQENSREVEVGNIPDNGNEPCHVPPIFVVGVWRSGTTLLYALLNQHPDIRLMYESDLPVLWPVFWLPWMRKSWAEKWEYWNAGLSRHDLNSTQLTEPVTSLAQAMEIAGRTYTVAKGKRLWGCKSPTYYDRLTDLAREFPAARFIIIWRDPEEICDSVIRAASSGMWFARPGAAKKALLASQTLKRQCDKLLYQGASVYQIHYRDLVEQTSRTMAGICRFLQVPYTPAVTILDKADRSAVFEGAHHKLAKGSRIISRRSRNESLPPGLARKIQRYKSLWKAKAGSSWLLSERFESTADTPGIGERIADHTWVTILRTWDIAPRILFSILPLSIWQAYRRIKYKNLESLRRQLTNKPSSLQGN